MTVGLSPSPSLTVIQWAFLRALLEWARRETHGAQLIAIPSGRVDPAELHQVLIALLCIRGGER
jgi:hypothetical protein